jgi:hypothetical protein
MTACYSPDIIARNLPTFCTFLKAAHQFSELLGSFFFTWLGNVEINIAQVAPMRDSAVPIYVGVQNSKKKKHAP